MKPTKNKVYCPAADRSKMLFETERKAENFIRFNAEEIRDSKGYAPQRAYYCEACGGWHVTHHKSYRSDTDNRNPGQVIQKYRIEQKRIDEERKRANTVTNQVVNELRSIQERLNVILFNLPRSQWNLMELTKLHARFSYLSSVVRAKNIKRNIRSLFDQIEEIHGSRIFITRTAV